MSEFPRMSFMVSLRGDGYDLGLALMSGIPGSLIPMGTWARCFSGQAWAVCAGQF